MANNDDTDTTIPGELLEVLGYAEMADALAEPILRIAERIHEKKLGQKVGRLLGFFAQEIVDIAKPVYEMVEARQKKVRELRAAFVYKFLKESPYGSSNEKINSSLVKAAIEILRMEKNEQDSMAKTIEIAGLKGQLSRREKSSDVDLSGLLSKLRNTKN